jgi:catechol 2,3-dioxygenase-like lactoylglutathione lyase family enzyme
MAQMGIGGRTPNGAAIRIKRLSHLALGVFDLNRQAAFYVDACGLQIVDQAPRHLYLRAAGSHHHAFELISAQSRLHHIAFEVVDDEELDRSVKRRRTPLPCAHGCQCGPIASQG